MAFDVHVKRHEDACAHLLGERLDVGLRLLVQIGNRQVVGLEVLERLGAAIGYRLVIRDSDDQPFLACERP